MSCILSVYHTGSINSEGFAGLGWGILGANKEGVNYADSVMKKYNIWVNYLSNQATS